MRPTVLIVNAPPGIETFLKNQWGNKCRFLSALNVADVYRHIAGGRLDAIVTDYRIPGVSVIDLVRSFRALPEVRYAPVAVFTGTVDPAMDGECKAAGISLVVEPGTPQRCVNKWFSSLIEAHDAASRPPELDRNMAQALVATTKDVMLGLLGVEPAEGALQVGKQEQRTADVIGSISLAGYVSGDLNVFMSTRLAKRVAAKMLGSEDDDRSDVEVIDAVGELTNMIAGNIKTSLCKKEELFTLSSPSVVMGREVRRASMSNNVSFALPCSLGGEAILVEFSMIPRCWSDVTEHKALGNIY